MDNLEIMKLLRWNDSGQPPRILTPRKALVAEAGKPCTACMVVIIKRGDLIEAYGDGWAITNCECGWKSG